MALRDAEKIWFIWGGATVVLWILAFVFASKLNTEDPGIYLRTLMSRTLSSTTSTLIATGLTIVVDRVTPGDWFEEIKKGNIACAIMLGAVFYGILSLLTWAQS
mgnify:CR=1 FL=1